MFVRWPKVVSFVIRQSRLQNPLSCSLSAFLSEVQCQACTAAGQMQNDTREQLVILDSVSVSMFATTSVVYVDKQEAVSFSYMQKKKLLKAWKEFVLDKIVSTRSSVMAFLTVPLAVTVSSGTWRSIKSPERHPNRASLPTARWCLILHTRLIQGA